MTADIRLGVQSRLVPGVTLRDRWEAALRYGFDGIELSGPSMLDLAAEAVRERVPVSAICGGHRGWPMPGNGFTTSTIGRSGSPGR